MKKTDTVLVDDPSGRRRFIRTGAAFILAGSSVASSQEEGLRVDCDRQGLGEEKNPEAAGSDSDTGATADRPGCGRKKPAMTQYNKKDRGDSVRVKKVIA